jgi:multimeric flavodoxin WrbA
MKLLAICSSPRKGATEELMKMAVEIARKEGADAELVLLREHDFHHCVHCDACIKKKALKCLRFNDSIDSVINKFVDADAILLGSPVYAMGMTPLMSSFISRLRWNYTLTEENIDFFSHKVGAALAVGGVRNGGQELTISSLQAAMGSKGMMIATGGRGVYEGVSIWSQNVNKNIAEIDPQGVENLEFMVKRLVKTGYLMSKLSELEEEEKLKIAQ